MLVKNREETIMKKLNATEVVKVEDQAWDHILFELMSPDSYFYVSPDRSLVVECIEFENDFTEYDFNEFVELREAEIRDFEHFVLTGESDEDFVQALKDDLHKLLALKSF